MKTTRQRYVDSTLADARADGCDIVQPKLRGLWVRIEAHRGIAHVYDDRGDSPTFFETPTDDVHCTLIGDLFGPPHHELSRIVVWDCWRVGQESAERPGIDWTDLTRFGYRDRFAFLKQQISRIGLPVVVVKTYPIQAAEELWNTMPDDACGLVYRRAKDPVDVTLRVARWYKEVPGGLP